MKSTHKIFILCLALCGNISMQAQWTPQIAHYPITNLPGATLAQVVDTINAHMSPTDTAEGGAQDQLITFNRLWQARVVVNDSSGLNMFQKYTREVGRAVAARIAAPCSGSGFQGDWQVAGPDYINSQTSGYVSTVW